jgi:proteasome lid subunit RPN8/RPN11
MKRASNQPSDSPGSPDEKDSEAEKIAVGQWSDEPKAVRRTFPGPRHTGVPLRVALDRKAFADVVGHAKESLDAEICGVLAGQVCEDDEGLFVHVHAAIRGSSARESNARVTFTQETWNIVHETLEREYPKLRMLGWYHSHPGFGVEFSEMDVFIQKNFFPSPTQIALVTDPLGGDTAICRNAEQGVGYLERFWVDGREHTLRVPAQIRAKEAGPGAAAASAISEEEMQSIERRLGQLIQAVDEQRASFHRFLITLLLLALIGIVTWIGYGIYSSFSSRMEPPRLNGYVPVPIRVGDKNVMIGVGVVQWDVPPELNATLLEMEKQKAAAAAKNGTAQPSPESSPASAASAKPGTQPATPAANPPQTINVTPPQPAAPKTP